MRDSLAQSDGFGRDMGGRRQVRKEEKKRQRVVEISQGINKCRVTLLDDMIQSQFRRMVLFQARRITNFSTS